MEKSEQRARLKRLQLIVHNRGDAELPQVIDRLKSEIADFDRIASPPAESVEAPEFETRSERGGRDRKRRGGYDREG